jgi:hypothetical protein
LNVKQAELGVMKARRDVFRRPVAMLFDGVGRAAFDLRR